MCFGYKLLYQIFPIPRLRAWIVGHHFEICPYCREEFASVDRTFRDLTGKPEWIDQEVSLWPSIRSRIQKEQPAGTKVKSESARVLSWGWRWAVAGLSLVLILSFNLMIRQPRRNKEAAAAGICPTETSGDVTVTSAELNGRKARHFIYRRDTKAYIWFVPEKDSGGE